MDDKLTRNDLAMMIRARQVLKQTGLAPDADIKTICEYAEISRKTGYQWANNFCDSGDKELLEGELEKLKAENERLKKELDDVRFENEGRKLAWEIHEVDEFLAQKKKRSKRRKRKKR